ncbi:endo-1,4-beta-xylanase [Arenibaculum pallidiluteum]|uniref:endo-1,4-beta-xylanase n=1 Tax=Arenibaculum pallidiluteum TaxID=2812559 RepID=UPI001A95C8B4|nr:endo-1,4-beta-xylanase [Arenibaculum pallidiluteum]
MTGLDRRSFLVASAAAGLSAATAAAPVAAAPAVQASGARPLRDHAARAGLVYGACGSTPRLFKDDAFADAFVREAGMLVPEGEMKWTQVEPEEGRVDYSAPDALLAWCQRNGLRMRGHHLVQGHAQPDWVEQIRDPRRLRDAIERHVTRTAAHYAGKLHSWDVVNEPFHTQGWARTPDGFRKAGHFSVLERDYIDIAFDAARRADPRTPLALNENALDYVERGAEEKRAIVLRELRAMKARGVPIDALGTQAHLWARYPLDSEGIYRFLSEVADLGLKIYVTELDVSERGLPATDITTRDRLIADHTRQYLDTVLRVPAVEAVLTWGLTDRYSLLNSKYRNQFRQREDGLENRGLPLDADLRRKPMWTAMTEAFDRRRT